MWLSGLFKNDRAAARVDQHEYLDEALALLAADDWSGLTALVGDLPADRAFALLFSLCGDRTCSLRLCQSEGYRSRMTEFADLYAQPRVRKAIMQELKRTEARRLKLLEQKKTAQELLLRIDIELDTTENAIEANTECLVIGHVYGEP